MSAALQFDKDSHRYTYNGVTVPNVTSVIESVLDSLAGIPADVLEYARLRGTAVHTATALYDLDDLEIESLDVAIFPYLEAWIKFRDDTGFIPTAIEEHVFHPRHFYAGTFDRSGRLFGEYALVDIKSGIFMPSAGPQTAAYLEARNHRNSDKITARWVVQLKPDGKYELHQMTDREDFSVFLSALTLSQWRRKNDC